MIVILIPARVEEPVRTDYPASYDQIGRLTFGDDETWFNFINVLPKQFQIGVDDMGTMRDPLPPLNERATRLAAYYGYGQGTIVPLYGNAIILGVHEMTGEWIDAPVEEIMTALATVTQPPLAGV